MACGHLEVPEAMVSSKHKTKKLAWRVCTARGEMACLQRLGNRPGVLCSQLHVSSRQLGEVRVLALLHGAVLGCGVARPDLTAGDDCAGAEHSASRHNGAFADLANTPLRDNHVMLP